MVIKYRPADQERPGAAVLPLEIEEVTQYPYKHLQVHYWEYANKQADSVVWQQHCSGPPESHQDSREGAPLPTLELIYYQRVCRQARGIVKDTTYTMLLCPCVCFCLFCAWLLLCLQFLVYVCLCVFQDVLWADDPQLTMPLPADVSMGFYSSSLWDSGTRQGQNVQI